MTKADLVDLYRDYIACLNRRDWAQLGRFVHDDAIHNDHRIGLAGYRVILERDVEEIPDLFFHVAMLVADPPYVASRIRFDCAPRGTFCGVAVNGRRVSFAEHVIYEFRAAKIAQVWSVIDKAAIEAQL